MNNRFNSTHRNYIIIGLCIVLIIMAVGYAAFSSQLQINGTSNITSNWDVKITDIQSKDIVGGAGNSSDPTHTDVAATFNATLQSPGDSITYDVIVSNQGTIDAKLDKITLSDSSNPAIKFETSGIKEGDLLLASQTATMKVKVSYDSNVTSQPENLNASLTVTLDYSQAPKGEEPPADPITTEELKALAVTEGDGLYADTYEGGRYIYKGANPNNYITFNNEEWRIMSVENDGKIKIIKNKAEAKAWDATNLNDWTRPADLNTYLNVEYLASIKTNKDKITNHDWSIGKIESVNSDLSDQIKKENSSTWNGQVGLLNVSEYLRANTNTEQCGTFYLNNENQTICKATNYLFNLTTTGTVWTISASGSDPNVVFSINSGSAYGGYIVNEAPNNSGNVFAPSLYLTSDITLTGNGSQQDPYVIN